MSDARHRLILVGIVATTGMLVPACRPAFRSLPGPLEPIDPAARPRADEFLKHVRVLSDVARGGRMVCTPGNALAREHIVKQFAATGLKPGGAKRSWFQPFPMEKLRVPGKAGFLRSGDGTEFAVDKDFCPMAAGRDGRFEGPLVFAGYGYRNKLLGYDDYARIDVSGCVVMIIRGTHRGTGRKSIWWKKGAVLRDALFDTKLRWAASAGATALLVVSPPGAPEKHDPLSSVIGKGRGKLPAVRISRTLADRLLKNAGKGRKLKDLAGAIRATGKPVSFSVPVRIAGRVDLAAATAQNVIGVLPATGGRKGPAIVVGAHYDHLPAGGHKARDAGIGVRPGADDNASGVSGLILLAKAASTVERRNCTWVFIAFDGEEFGFRGSKYHADHPAFPLHRTAAMINLDQIGKMRSAKVFIIGNVLRKPMSGAIAAAAALGDDLNVTTIPFVQRTGWSDQAAFARRGVPTLFFYTGRTREYHRMTDTVDRVNAVGGAKVATLALDVVRALDICFGPAEPAASP